MDPGLNGLPQIFGEVRALVNDPDPARFGEVALRVFRFQYESVPAYRRFCDRRGRTPGNVDSWEAIPAIPLAAFKHVVLAPGGLPEGLTFLTSGTTETTRGRHRVPVPEIYREAAIRHFERQVLPDGVRPRFLVLAPPVDEAPGSSLGRMIHWLNEELGAGEATHFVSGGDVRLEAFAETLRDGSADRTPLLLIGLTDAFVRFHDHCRANGLTFRLPYGSRIVDTGGTKRSGRRMSRKGLLRAFWEDFGVAGYFVSNEYGMTEMCSQFYDSAIRDHFDGRKRDRRKVGPPWVRTTVVSPVTLEPVPPGVTGLLRHVDLANVGSVAALQTEDLGTLRDEGFEITGRAAGAELRGCALLLNDATS